MKGADAIARAAAYSLLRIGAIAYGVKVHGLDDISKDQGAVFGVKHANSLDLPLMAYVLWGEKTILLASSHIFNNPASNYILRTLGAMPLYTAPDYKALRLNGHETTHRAMIEQKLGQNWRVAYAPEGNVAKDRVRKDIYPQMLMKAAGMGHDTYLVGVKFRNTKHPMLSFVRWPWQPGIEVRIEKYDAKNKQLNSVTEEVREALVRLSRLEQKIESYSTARNNR